MLSAAGLRLVKLAPELVKMFNRLSICNQLETPSASCTQAGLALEKWRPDMSMLATADARCLTQGKTASLTGSCILSVDQTAEGCPNIFAQFRHTKLHTVLLHASTPKRTCRWSELFARQLSQGRLTGHAATMVLLQRF